MPRIQIRDGLGTNYQIVSTNPVLIGAWMAEIIGRLISADSRLNHPVQMDIWPDFVYDPKTGKDEMDWIPHQAPRLYRPDQMQKLAQLLQEVEDMPEPDTAPKITIRSYD